VPGRLAAWRALSGADRRRLLGLAFALPVVELSLRCFGAQRTATWLSRAIMPGPPRQATTDELRQADRLAQLAAIAGGRGIVTARCLSQALLVRALLRRRGLDPDLRIGVLKDERSFDAHAWLELEGRALAQPSLQHVPFPSGDRITSATR
jgi:hypothetical protein